MGLPLSEEITYVKYRRTSGASSEKFLDMEVSMSLVLRDSMFVEMLMLIISIRIIWSSITPISSSFPRDIPLILFVFRRNLMIRECIESQLETLIESPSTGMLGTIREIREVRTQSASGNLLESRYTRSFPLLCSLFLTIGFYYWPVVLTAGIIADLLVARIHHHIIRSL
jgi:hypothetical protein